jgi:2,6-dihydroxypyridine 3-monooxygenase
MTTMPRVAVAGGSIGGLTAALTLRDIGCEVDIYERSSAKLESRGAGIAVLQETSRYLTQRMGLPLDAFCSSTSRLQFLNADGTVLHDQHHDYHFSAWNTIYRFLHTEFERIPDRYHLGSEVTSFVSDDDGVTVNFTSGDPLHVDLLVCADGIKSPARHALLPDVKSEYAGYVAWRGTVPEKDLSPETYDLLYDALTYQVLENSHILVYPIPDHDGATSPGHRLMNIVWYRNLTPNGDYEAAFTDTTGYVHDISLPPGAGSAISRVLNSRQQSQRSSPASTNSSPRQSSTSRCRTWLLIGSASSVMPAPPLGHMLLLVPRRPLKTAGAWPRRSNAPTATFVPRCPYGRHANSR